MDHQLLDKILNGLFYEHNIDFELFESARKKSIEMFEYEESIGIKEYLESTRKQDEVLLGQIDSAARNVVNTLLMQIQYRDEECIFDL